MTDATHKPWAEHHSIDVSNVVERPDVCKGLLGRVAGWQESYKQTPWTLGECEKIVRNWGQHKQLSTNH
jgi:hypothetical protein